MKSRPIIAFLFSSLMAVTTLAGQHPPTRQSLDGTWQIVKDEKDEGVTRQWFLKQNFPGQEAVPIPVPGNIWEALPYYSDRCSWYATSFVRENPPARDLACYLRFGAVQYFCKVWLNGVFLGDHEGGESPFEFDVTNALVKGDNQVIVRVINPSDMSRFPIAYPMGGIIGHVSLDCHPLVRITDVFVQPDIGTGKIDLAISLENRSGSPADAQLIVNYGVHNGSHLGSVSSTKRISPGADEQTMTLAIDKPRLWSPSDPFLYSIRVAVKWKGKSDEFDVPHVGFKDFRITTGSLYSKPWFHLNNKRIFVRSTHSNAYDPRYIQGTPRDTSILARELRNLKMCGYNMFRSISLAMLPELLDLADEMGLMIWEEHAGSWFMANPAKFVPSISGVIRRDRNHPCVAIWGCLNENTALLDTARAYLPTLRKDLDMNRLVCLSSGRFDMNGKQASFSNPGSTTWDAYIGGEDPIAPVQSFNVPDQYSLPPEQFISLTTGDIHTYSNWPVSWAYRSCFATIGAGTRPVFLSEAGVGSLYDPIGERALLQAAGVPQTIRSWEWAGAWATRFEDAWKRYNLFDTYPDIRDLFTDSQLSQAAQREQQFTMVRGNPNIMGFSATGFNDTWGYPEGIMDNFGNMKAGLTRAVQEGWAPLRWCLTVNPMSVYTDSAFRVKVDLANEDQLVPGNYPVTLAITGTGGKVVWSKNTNVSIPANDAPMAYSVINEEIKLTALTEGDYALSASLAGVANAAADTLNFHVFSRGSHPAIAGRVTLLGVNGATRDILAGLGVEFNEFKEGEPIDHEVILAGDVPGRAEAWRQLYRKAARGAHVIFLDKDAFRKGSDANHWIAVPEKGTRQGELSRDLYHHEFVAKNHPIFNTLKIKVLTPDLYDQLLRCGYLMNITVPDEVVAVGFHDGEGGYSDGVMIGTWNHFAGKFTINMMNLTGHIGEPVADRILLNMIARAMSDAAPAGPLPGDYETRLTNLGITD